MLHRLLTDHTSWIGLYSVSDRGFVPRRAVARRRRASCHHRRRLDEGRLLANFSKRAPSLAWARPSPGPMP